MKLAVIGGTGAMGALFAGRLFQQGHEVHILGSNQTTVDAINEHGLTVTSPHSETSTLRISATSNPATIGPCDLVLVLVKALHTSAAIDHLPALTGASTGVLTLQNGWGPGEQLAAVVPPAQLALGVTYLGAMVVSPGRINHTLLGETLIGPYLDGEVPAWLAAAATAFQNAGLPTTLMPSISDEIWKKLIVNGAGLPVAALTHLRTGALGADPDLLLLCDALIIEAVAVAKARGITIDLDERIAYVRALLGRGGAGKPSMLQDVEAQRLTEIDVINGAIVREAERLGLDAPLHRAMVALIHGRERSWQ